MVRDDTVRMCLSEVTLPVVSWPSRSGGSPMARGGAVLTVGSDPAEVEARLSSAALCCPNCGGRLTPWGHGRSRTVRGEGSVRWQLRPRRARCALCGATHILLPVSCLIRRADAVDVIGAALVASAAGAGHRHIAEVLSRPASTVRGWLRRSRARAGPIREVFTMLACALWVDAGLPEPAGSALADALAAIQTCVVAAGSRWGDSVVTTSAWRVAAAVSAGRLLTPGFGVESINTSRPW